MKSLTLIILFVFSLNLYLHAGNEVGESSQSAGYYIYLGEGDELLISVQIWGQVKSPGLYSLPEKSDVVTLLSLAGGPTENADLSKIRMIRKGIEKDSLFTINLKKALLEGDKEKVILKPGDIIEIIPSKFYSFSTFVRFVAQISMIVAVYYQIFGK
ncbi:SLBB domain-containing protein [candidate division WOR-3 bacterium]|nr:SLBB domain-containing protein [candidate division WOR-3 bacterium]